MKHKIICLLIALLCLSGTGCGDYLKEYSRELAYASSWEDLDELLIGSGYIRRGMEEPSVTGQYFPFIYVMDDDAEEVISANPSTYSSCYVSYLRNAATWQPIPYVRSFANSYTEWEDSTPQRLYELIANLNVISRWVDEFENDPVEEKMRLRGESQFLRAYYYLMLSNLYGWAYDPANDGADLSVPLKTSEWITNEKFSRATIKDVYGTITRDLENACLNLKHVEQPNFYRASSLASHILASRVYLYMEDYDNVITHCDAALDMGCPLSDLNTYVTGPTMLDRTFLMDPSNPEIVFTMGLVVSSRFLTGQNYYRLHGSYVLSDDLLSEFRDDAEVKDTRITTYFKSHARIPSLYGLIKNIDYSVYTLRGRSRVYDTFLLRTVEVYLNKAEAQAMKGDLSGATATLLPLLETRYAAGMLRLRSERRSWLTSFVRSAAENSVSRAIVGPT